jgi:hypothetical protein
LGVLDPHARSFLYYLGLDRQEPGLDYLNALVRQHQLKVPFETLTKIIDYERGYREGNFLPEIGRYVERTVGGGPGGDLFCSRQVPDRRSGQYLWARQDPVEAGRRICGAQQ